MSTLGPDWVPGPTGLRERNAARVLLLDEGDRLLLARGHDLDNPGRSWWFTVGGGIDPGETPRQGAARELLEEAGIAVDPEGLIGPVFTRHAIFDFAVEHVRQYEEYFMARVPAADLDASRAGWTDLEREFMDELRWWSLPQLREVDLEVFPIGLADLVEPLLSGWDGRTLALGEQDERDARRVDAVGPPSDG